MDPPIIIQYAGNMSMSCEARGRRLVLIGLICIGLTLHSLWVVRELNSFSSSSGGFPRQLVVRAAKHSREVRGSVNSRIVIAMQSNLGEIKLDTPKMLERTDAHLQHNERVREKMRRVSVAVQQAPRGSERRHLPAATTIHEGAAVLPLPSPAPRVSTLSSESAAQHVPVEAVVVIGSPSELLVGKPECDVIVRLLALAATASGYVPRDLILLLNGPSATRALVIDDWLRTLRAQERRLAELNLAQLRAAGFHVDVLPGLPTVPVIESPVGMNTTKRKSNSPTVHPSWRTLQHRKGHGHAKYYHWIRSAKNEEGKAAAAAGSYERFWFVEWDVAFTGKWSTLFDRELQRGPADVVAAKSYRASCSVDPQARGLRPPCTKGRRVPKAHLYLERIERRFVVDTLAPILDEGVQTGFSRCSCPAFART